MAQPCPTHSTTLNKTGSVEFTACVANAGYYFTEACALQCGVCAMSGVFECQGDTRRELYEAAMTARELGETYDFFPPDIGRNCRCPGNLMPCNANHYCPGGALPDARKWIMVGVDVYVAVCF